MMEFLAVLHAKNHAKTTNHVKTKNKLPERSLIRNSRRGVTRCEVRMKLQKRLIMCGVLVLLLGCAGSANADICYDPHYGNYECDPGYNYYPDQGQTVMEGVIAGMVFGALLNDGGGWGGGRHGRDDGGHHDRGGGHHR